MFARLIVIFALAAGALSTQYPDGLHPAVCPNYPFCDIDVLARFTPSGMPIPLWVSNPSLLPVAPTDYENVAVAPRYPADVNPAVCPNYPYCDAETMARYTPSGDPMPLWMSNPALLPVAATNSIPKYPAGLHPAVCPNYPYCDADILARITPSGMPIPQWQSNPSLLPVATLESKSEDTAPKYPAGLHPAVCPNYPYCDAEVLARFTPSGIPIPQWESNPSLLPLATPEYCSSKIVDDAPKYPADMDPALCPDYPYCS